MSFFRSSHTSPAAAGTFFNTIASNTPALRAAERAGVVAFLAAVTAAASQVSIPLPFTAVPFTLQPVIVLVGAAAVGARLGTASQLLYLAAGIAGLPVFAASPLLAPGAFRLLGPTGGYLIAYPAAAFLTGRLAERGFDRRYSSAVLAMCGGLSIVYAGGVAWLAMLDPVRGLPGALRAGFLPFIGADLVKLLGAAAVMPSVWRFSVRRSR